MNRRRVLRFAPPIAVLVFTCVFLMLTLQLPVAARSAPLMTAWITLFLAVIDIITRLRNPAGHLLMRMLNPAGVLEGGELPTRQEVRLTLQAIGLMALLVVGLLLIGVLPASAMFLVGALMFGGAGRRLAIGLAVVFTLLLWAVFAVLLHLTPFPGLLFGGFI